MLTNTNKTKWETALIGAAQRAVTNHEFWRERFVSQDAAIHLAVLAEPYLQYILDGQKTIESRFSANRCAPYQQVKEGDVILLKRSGGPVVGLCEVSKVWYYELESASWQEIKMSFAKALCAQDPAFWKDRESASFATLMQIQYVTSIEPVTCRKRDRRGWVVLTRDMQDGEHLR